MAFSYGPYGPHHRTVFEYVSSSDAANTYITVKMHIQMGTYRSSDGTWLQEWNSSWQGSGSSSPYWYIGPGAWQLVKSWSFSIPRLYGAAQSTSFSGTTRTYLSTASHSITISIPARAYLAPRPPLSASVARVSDTQADITWVRDADSTSGARPWTGVYIDRWSKTTNTWTRVATVTGTGTTWSDKGISANNQYKYRVSSYNGSGTSTPKETTAFATTPIAPTGITATKTGLNIIVKWTNRAVHQDGTIIYDNGVQIATVGAGIITYTHTSPAPEITHTYTTRATTATPVLQSALSTPSNTVQLQAPPNAPLKLGRSNNLPNTISIESTGSVTLVWTHNPVDSSSQTERRLQYQAPGSSSWITLVEDLSSTEQYTFNPTVLGVSPGNYNFRVYTKGADPGWSPASATYKLVKENDPTVATLVPTPSTVINTSQVTLDWTYSQAQSRPQSSTYIELREGSPVVYSTTRTGTSTIFKLPHMLKDDTAYTLRYYATSASGLKSDTQVINFSVNYAEPDAPELTIIYNEATGANQITIVNGTTSIATEFNQVYRNVNLKGDWVNWDPETSLEEPPFIETEWEYMGTFPLNAVVIDTQGKTAGKTLYRVEAVSDIPSSTHTTALIVNHDHKVWMGAGLSFENRIAIPFNFTLNESVKLVDSEIFYPEGEIRPIYITGDAYEYLLEVSGSLDPQGHQGSTWQEYLDFMRIPGTKIYQDRDGRRIYASISGNDTRKSRGLYDVSYSIQEVGYDPT